MKNKYICPKDTIRLKKGQKNSNPWLLGRFEWDRIERTGLSLHEMKEGSQRRRGREGAIVASSQHPCPSSFLTLSLAEDSAILGRCWSSSKKSGWSPRFCISSEFPGNADVSVQEPHWNSSLYARSYTHFFQTSLCPRSVWEMWGGGHKVKLLPLLLINVILCTNANHR